MKTFKEFVIEAADVETALKNHTYWKHTPVKSLDNDPLKKRLLSKPYNREHHEKMLEKTQHSINSHLRRAGDSAYYGKRTGEPNRRTFELRHKYDTYRENMLHHDKKGWHAWCEKVGADPTHDGHDAIS